MDPNWFYSTLAQSTAAIVGLAGGFLVSWLLSRRNEIIVERLKHIESLRRLIDRMKAQRNRAEDIGAQVQQVLRLIHDQLAAGVSYQNLDIPKFELLSHMAYEVPRPSENDLAVLETIPTICQQLHNAIVSDRRELARAILNGDPLGAPGASEYRTCDVGAGPFSQTGIGGENFWPGLRRQHEYAIGIWQELAREYESIAAAVREFRGRLVPKSIYFLILILLGLVGAGVIAPMMFLSAQDGQSKYFLLVISATLILAFVGYLGSEVKTLRRAADLSRDNI